MICCCCSSSSCCSIFTGLPDTFEVARYHSLHGIRDKLPPELQVTALSEDGIVMGIQHVSLPFAAVQFHPESILTSPAHGMTILENVLTYVKYDDGVDDLTPKSGAEIVGQLEQLPLSELQRRMTEAGLAIPASKSELVVRLALWTHKSKELKARRLHLEDMTTLELAELKQGLGLRGTATTKEELLDLLKHCLLV